MAQDLRNGERNIKIDHNGITIDEHNIGKNETGNGIGKKTESTVDPEKKL